MAYVRGLPYGGHDGPPFYFEGKYYYPNTCFELKENFIKQYEEEHGDILYPYMKYEEKCGNNVRLASPLFNWFNFPDKEEFTTEKLQEMSNDFFSRTAEGRYPKYPELISIPFWQLSSVIKRIIKSVEASEEDIKKREAAMEGYLPRRMQSKEYKKAHPWPIFTCIVAIILGFAISFGFEKGAWLGPLVCTAIIQYALKKRGIH